MIRFVLAIFAIVLGLSVAVAQDDPIKVRKALMKANGDAAKTGVAMMKGEKPFDLAEVHKIFATFEDAAAKMPELFPDSSKSEANSRLRTISPPALKSGKTWPISKRDLPSSARMPRRPPHR